MSEPDPVRPSPRRARAMPPPGSPARPEPTGGTGMVDAEAFLAFTGRLHAARERVERARVSAEQRSRWQTRLLAITDGARADLDRAVAQLTRFEGELDRQLRG